MVDERTDKQRESYFAEYEELLARRRWLLWHNSAFRSEFNDVYEIVKEETDYRLPERFLPEGLLQWNAEWLLQGNNIRSFDKCRAGRKFLLKHGLVPPREAKGNFDVLDELKHLRFDAKSGKWDLDTVDAVRFWNETIWYRSRIQGCAYKDIAKFETEDNPTWVDLMTLRFLLKSDEMEHKAFINSVDPRQRMRTRYKGSELHNRMLYSMGIFKIGIAKADLGYPQIRFPPVKAGASVALLNGCEYFVRYDNTFDERSLFYQKPEKDVDRKRKDSFRAEFLRYREEYCSGGSWSNFQKVIRDSVKRMEERIASVVSTD